MDEITNCLKIFCRRWIKLAIKRIRLTVGGKKCYDIPDGLSNKGVEKIGHFNRTADDFRQKLKEFSRLYSQRPIKNNIGGMNSAHMFYCWFMTKQLRPEFIIESGVWKGQSTWLLEMSAPQAKIISIDPNLKRRKYISKKAQYYTKDFASIDWSSIPKEKTLCFFDDHYGIDRIKQCNEFGFKHILYDDNYPLAGGNQNHPSGNALSPKAAFYVNNKDILSLRPAIKTYYEFPPICPNRSDIRFKSEDCKGITPEPLMVEISDDAMKIYTEEAWGYSWICYIELK